MLYESINTIFLKVSNDRDRERIRGCQGLGTKLGRVVGSGGARKECHEGLGSYKNVQHLGHIHVNISVVIL